MMGHITTVSRIVEDKKASGDSIALAILYDEYRRRDWARRAAHQEPNLDIETESWSIDDDLLKSVSTRLRTTLAAVGLGDPRTPGSSSSGSNLVDVVVEASKESSNAKLAAALEAQKRKQDNRERDWQNNPKGSCKGGKNRHRGNRNCGGGGGGGGGNNNRNPRNNDGRDNRGQGGGGSDGRRVIPRNR